MDILTTLDWERLRAELTSTLATWGPRVIGALLVIVAGWFIARWLRKTIRRVSERATIDATLVPFLAALSYYGTLTLTLLAAIRLIGVDTTVPISPFLPMIMFAILFGLSMDYEVFLLSRVREEYVRTGDSHQSVVDGLASTARVITSAALIMISVFAAFLLMPDIEIKMFAVGLSVAVLIDATVVRMVLVPSTMALMGDANWWLPGWLDRLLPHVDVEGSAILHGDPSAVTIPDDLSELDDLDGEHDGGMVRS